MVKECPRHGRFEDVMSMDPAFLGADRATVPGARLRVAANNVAARPRQLDDQVRPRLGADGRSDEPLQHDVRPVLHGREPGGLRPRARMGRREEDPGRRARESSRAGQLSVQFSGGEPTLSPHFLRGYPLRARGRLLLRAVRLERHPLRARPGVLQGGQGGRASGSVTCSSTASRTRPTAHRKVGNLFDVKLRAIREPRGGGHRRGAGRDGRERREQRRRSVRSSSLPSTTPTR